MNCHVQAVRTLETGDSTAVASKGVNMPATQEIPGWGAGIPGGETTAHLDYSSRKLQARQGGACCHTAWGPGSWNMTLC